VVGSTAATAATAPAAALAFGAPATPPRPEASGWAAAQQSLLPSKGSQK